ncbi:hypothetical protein LINGRAHAP2_LOCUS23200, partial [Linum grandiflorum]
VKVNCPLTKTEKDKTFLAEWSANDDENDESDSEDVPAYMAIATKEESHDKSNSMIENIVHSPSGGRQQTTDGGRRMTDGGLRTADGRRWGTTDGEKKND